MTGKRVTIPLLLVWLAATPGLGQEWARALFNNKLTHDFGTVARGALAEHRFPLENIYEEDVEIASVTTTCGCTKLQATKKLLKKYDTAEIVAELDTRRFIGFKEAAIKVALAFRPPDPSRKPVPAEVQLTLRAFIRGDVVFKPGAVQFASVPQGQGARKQVGVDYAGRTHWQIVEVTSTSTHLDASFAETGRKVDPATGATLVTYDLTVALKNTAPAGYFKEQVTLKTNDPNPQTARIPLTVEGLVASALTVNPSVLLLGVLQPGQGQSTPKNLVVRGAEPFRILRVTGPDERFSFTPSSETKTVHLVPVHFTPGNRPGKIAGKIRIETSLGGATAEVDVDGEVVSPDSAKPGDRTPRSAPLREVEPSGGKRPSSGQ